MKHNRVLPLLTPFIVFTLFELFFFNPKIVYVALVFANLLIFFTITRFTKESDASKDWWNFLILPALFTTGLAAYSVLFANNFIVQLLFVFNLVFLYFYLKIIYYYLIRVKSYKNLSLENISSYGNFLAFFFVSSVVYGLQSFLNMPVWPLMVIMAAVAALMIHQMVWANMIEEKFALVYVLIGSLVLVELAWSLSFLPLNFNAAGLILAICYYMLTGLVRHHLSDNLKKRTVKLYLSLGLGSILLILLTTRWM